MEAQEEIFMVNKQITENMIQKDKQALEIEVSEVNIRKLIYVIRGKQVMLDSDLAMLYQVDTGALNRAVKINSKRFPDDFCFQLTNIEKGNAGGRRYMPYVFTEQGISMLSAVLHSETAINVSIGIMRAFVEMRSFLSNNSLMFERINEVEVKQLEFQKSSEEKFDKIFNYISEHEESSQKIFLEDKYMMLLACLLV